MAIDDGAMSFWAALEEVFPATRAQRIRHRAARPPPPPHRSRETSARPRRRTWAPGAALVGDAADFFDPFTGEGIYSALRGGEMLAAHLLAALGATSRSASDDSLSAYDRARRAEFRGKWIVERLISAAVGFAPAMNYFARTLEARKDMADLLVGVTGDFVPAREVLRPGYLLNLFRQPSFGRRPLPDA